MSRRPLRIVHCISSAAFAGVERHVALLAAGQAAAGHPVAVIGGEGRAMHAAFGGRSVLHREASSVTEVIRELAAFRHSDIVHAHMTAAEVAATVAPAVRSRPVVATRHFAQRRGMSRSGRLVAPVVARRLAAQIAISGYVAQAIDGPSTVVHPGVLDAPPVAPEDRRRTVLVVQRLEREKRTEDAIEVFASSGLADQGWRLTIAGDGSQRRDLADLARRRGVGPVTDFLGHRRDVPALMRSAGLLLAPCDIEGLGLTVLEAMAEGLPVVACAAGGHLETAGVAPGSALYPPGDLSRGAGLLCGLAADEQQRRRYGQALRDIQRRRFTVEAQVAGTDAVYRSALGEDTGGVPA